MKKSNTNLSNVNNSSTISKEKIPHFSILWIRYKAGHAIATHALVNLVEFYYYSN